MFANAVYAMLEGATNAFPVTQEMLSGVGDSINSAIGVVLPVAVPIMGLIIGIKFIPSLVKKFTKG